MKPLIVGNSHGVGFKKACDVYGINVPYIPIPLCKNFKKSILENTPFLIEPLWKNMREENMKETSTKVVYDMHDAWEHGILIMVGNLLFGALGTIFLPLIKPNDNRIMAISIEGLPFSPCFTCMDEKFSFVSKKFLIDSFVGITLNMIEDYKYIFQKFKKIFWIPSPPLAFKYIRSNAQNYISYFATGIYYNYVDAFLQHISIINRAEFSKNLNLELLPFPENSFLKNGFLKENFCYSQSPADIHANYSYYSFYLKYIQKYL